MLCPVTRAWGLVPVGRGAIDACYEGRYHCVVVGLWTLSIVQRVKY
jgi:hypothetical protein